MNSESIDRRFHKLFDGLGERLHQGRLQTTSIAAIRRIAVVSENIVKIKYADNDLASKMAACKRVSDLMSELLDTTILNGAPYNHFREIGTDAFDLWVQMKRQETAELEPAAPAP